MSEHLRSTFRCVMLTDDTQIDRRILLQAKTLLDHGAEVILLSQGGGGYPDHELQDGLKIERYYAPVSDASLAAKFLWLQQKFVNRLNSRSAKLQNSLNAKFGARNAKLASFKAKDQYFKAGYQHLNMRRLLKLHPLMRRYTVTAPAVISLAVATKLGKIANRLTPPKSLDLHLADLVARHRPDIVHVHDLPQLEAGVIVKRRLGIPLVYDAHELYPEIGTLTPDEQKKLGRKEKRLSRKADARSTVNPYIAREMGKRYRISEPKVLLNATCRPDNFHVGDSRLRDSLGLLQDDQILLFQGWYHESRGLRELIRAMAQVRTGVHLVFLGYGQRVEGEALASKLGVRDRVHFLDKVPWDELLHWTTGADAGIIPYQKSDLNNYYCSPNKLFEFIVAELPLISNDFPYLRDVIAANRFGITADLSTSESFATAINAMFDTRTRQWETFGDALKNNWADWSWKSQEATLLNMYKSMGFELYEGNLKAQ